MLVFKFNAVNYNAFLKFTLFFGINIVYLVDNWCGGFLLC